MPQERIQASFGVVPIYSKDTQPLYLVVQHTNGKHWGFPKGRAETEEAPLTTALRELGEETGVMSCDIIDPVPIRESYEFDDTGVTVKKTVLYFIGLVPEKTLEIQQGEIEDARWVTEEEGEEIITFPETKAILHEAAKRIAHLNK